jgi:orotate phosphoribosyltransferase
LGMVSIFTYGFDLAEKNFEQAALPLHSLSNYEVLIQEAEKLVIISAGEISSLQAWRQAPDQWKGM